MIAPSFAVLKHKLADSSLTRVFGRVREVVGLVIEATCPGARVGDLCLLEQPKGPSVPAEVVGF